MAAISRGDAEKALALLAGAAKDFDSQRLRIVGSAIKAPLGEIAVETVVGDITTAGIQGIPTAISGPAKKPGTQNTLAEKSVRPVRAKKSTGKISAKKARRPVRGAGKKEAAYALPRRAHETTFSGEKSREPKAGEKVDGQDPGEKSQAPRAGGNGQKET